MRTSRRLFLPLTLVFVLPLAQSAKDPEPGSVKSRWPIKTSLPSGADLKKASAVKLADFLALPPAAEHAETKFETTRYPKAAGAKVGDGDVVSTIGYLRLVAYEADGDYHIQISETPDTFDNCLIVEVPNDDAKFVTDSPDVLAAAKTVRAWVIHNLLKDAEPTVDSVHPMKGQAYVQVTGQLFFDSEHQAAMSKNDFRGKSINGKQLPSKTSWEIHPVTNITFAPKPQ